MSSPIPDPVWRMPGPRSTATALPSPKAWRDAEAGLGRALADAAAEVARLDERLRGRDPGLIHRLALEEAEALATLSGANLTPGRLALAEMLHAGLAEDDARVLRGATWAVRRLRSGRAPRSGGLSEFLNRQLQAEGALGDLAQRPEGEGFAALAHRWDHALSRMKRAHPLTRAGFAHHLWQGLGLSAPGDALESGTIAGLLAAEDLRGGLAFVPIARAGGDAHMPAATASDLLQTWLGGVRRGCLSALMALDALSAWEDRARAATEDLSGRTPPRLIAALASAPVLSAEAAQQSVGCSRDAAERNLALFEARGLAREVTGQKRFRLWRASV